MAAPTFVDEHEATSWLTSASSKATSAFTANASDVLVVIAASEDNMTQITGVSGGGLTWTQQQAVQVASYCTAYIYTATVVSTGSITITVTASNSTVTWGFNVLRFSGSSGIGASSKTNVASGAPTLNLTTTAANSAIVVVNADWTATDGASRTWRTNAGTFTEQTYARNASNYTVYGGFHADAGATSTYAVGLSAPSGQKYAIASLEVKGTSSGNATVTPSAVATTTALPSATTSTGSTVSPAAALAVAATPSATESAGSTTGPVTVTSSTTTPTAALSTGSTSTPGPAAAVTATPPPALSTGSTATANAAPATVAIPAPTVGAAATPAPATIAAVAAFPAATKSAGSTPMPPLLAAVTATPAATLTVGGSATVPAASITAVTALPPSGISAGSKASPTALAALAALPAPVVALGALVAPGAVTAAAQLPAAAFASSTVTTPSTVPISAGVPHATIAGTGAGEMRGRDRAGPSSSGATRNSPAMTGTAGAGATMGAG